MPADQSGMDVLVTALEQGADEATIWHLLLGTRRADLNRRSWCIPWEELEDQRWRDKRTFQQHGAQFEGLLKRHARGIYLPAYWNCLWGLEKPKAGKLARWIMVTVEEEDGQVKTVHSCATDPREISRVGKIAMEEMVQEIHSAAVSWQKDIDSKACYLGEMVKSFEVENKVLVSHERYFRYRIGEALERLKRGDSTNVGFLLSLDEDSLANLDEDSAEIIRTLQERKPE